jgi:hypothetical protein
MKFPAAIRPSRRGVITSVITIFLAAGLAAALTTKIAVSHYRAEHVSAVQVRSEHDALIADKNRLEHRAEQRLITIQRLQTRLASKGNDLRYAIGRWHAVQRKVAALRTTAASLRSDLAAANAKAKSSYDTGYQAGVADAGTSFSAGDPSTDGCDPNYEGACVPTGYGDVNCDDVIETDFDVVGYDVYGLDGDEDGIACESW